MAPNPAPINGHPGTLTFTEPRAYRQSRVPRPRISIFSIDLGGLLLMLAAWLLGVLKAYDARRDDPSSNWGPLYFIPAIGITFFLFFWPRILWHKGTSRVEIEPMGIRHHIKFGPGWKHKYWCWSEISDVLPLTEDGRDFIRLLDLDGKELDTFQIGPDASLPEVQAAIASFTRHWQEEEAFA